MFLSGSNELRSFCHLQALGTCVVEFRQLRSGCHRAHAPPGGRGALAQGNLRASGRHRRRSETLTAILITHEHSDHICGLQVIARKLDIPIYMSRLTAPTIPWAEDFAPKLELFAAGCGFPIGDIDVTSFTIPHDAADPVGFSFRAARRQDFDRHRSRLHAGFDPLSSARFRRSAARSPITMSKC